MAVKKSWHDSFYDAPWKKTVRSLVESAKEAILSVLCVRKPHLALDDDGGNVHKLNETKKLNQAMVALSR